MTDMTDLVGKEFTNKNNRKFTVVEYLGKFKKNESAKSYQHNYTVEFLLTKNKYTYNRNQIKGLTCRDLEFVKIKNRLDKREKQEKSARVTGKGSTYQYKKFDFKDKYVLGLDLSTKLSAWSVERNGESVKYGAVGFENDMSKKKLEEIKEFKEIQLYPKELDFRKRIKLMIYSLNKLIRKSDIILIEDTQLQNNAKTFAMLSELRGGILTLCYMHNKEYEILPPTKWRKSHNFISRKREDLKKEAIDRFKLETGIQYPIDDVPEAYFIAKSGKKLLSE